MSTAKPTVMLAVQPLYVARQEAAAMLSISETTLEALVAKRDAPAPRRLSAGRVAWLVEDLVTWARERPVSDALPPINSGFGRAGKPASNLA